MSSRDEAAFTRWSRLKRERGAKAAADRPARRRGGAEPRLAAVDQPPDAAPIEAPPSTEPKESAAVMPTGPAADAGPRTEGEGAPEVDADADAQPDLPDIDTLDANSDYTVFMREGVPEHLRRLALRKLWLSNPVFANLDGLNDYDEDFRLIHALVGEVKSLYQVGKGMPTIGDDWHPDTPKAPDADPTAAPPPAATSEDSGTEDTAADESASPDEASAEADAVPSDLRTDLDEVGDGEDEA